MQQLEGGLKQDHLNSLEIEKFIFHIVNPDAAKEEDQVIYMDEVALKPTQQVFFLERLKEIAEGTQYIFRQDIPNIKEACESLENDFDTISRTLAANFSLQHSGRMSGGLFVVCIVKYLASANNYKKLIFLVKMDNQPSITYEYKEVGGKKIATVTDIKNALNESKKAVQKSALIDIGNVFLWDILAFDRVFKPTLAEFFKKFLGVKERNTNSQLTKVAFQTVKEWAKAIPQEELPEGEDAATYAQRALNFLCDNDVFDTDNFISTVVRDEENTERKNVFSASLKEKLNDKGVAGQSFIPQPNAIKPKDKKYTYITAEGVTITFEGSREAVGFNIQPTNKGKRIIIDTDEVSLKS
ncbi:nucleoid-associated protein [Acinetobacter baumannii]|uniref:nucleoid-associated protein n=1 Tax=Acinetobacter calcoaceticus/baumannii complex TaxID=909768 RepID=UPI0024DED1C2|nr:nucleoid-associated protein [Acinetobacter nosocomialis]